MQPAAEFDAARLIEGIGGDDTGGAMDLVEAQHLLLQPRRPATEIDQALTEAAADVGNLRDRRAPVPAMLLIEITQLPREGVQLAGDLRKHAEAVVTQHVAEQEGHTAADVLA